MTKPTVLILGANGRFGGAAVRAFAASGWHVLAQARRAPNTALPVGAQALAVPLENLAALVAAAQGAHTIVYAVNPLYTDWEAQMLPLARLGMDLADRLKATLILPGNVYNFGATMPALLSETTPWQPSNRKGQLRCMLEDEMRKRATQGLRSVVVRAGDFYGSGTGSWMDQLIVKDIARGKLAYPGPLDVSHAWAYLPDLAHAFVALATRPSELNRRLNSSSTSTQGSFESFCFAGHTFTGRELLAAIEQAAHELELCPPGGFRIGGMPWGLIRAVGVVYPLWREVARMRYLWRVPHRLDGAALEREVGRLPVAEPRLALRDSLLEINGEGYSARIESSLVKAFQRP